jgi:hypothetical protein
MQRLETSLASCRHRGLGGTLGAILLLLAHCLVLWGETEALPQHFPETLLVAVGSQSPAAHHTVARRRNSGTTRVKAATVGQKHPSSSCNTSGDDTSATNEPYRPEGKNTAWKKKTVRSGGDDEWMALRRRDIVASASPEAQVRAYVRGSQKRCESATGRS